jgi:hypothetical protein
MYVCKSKPCKAKSVRICKSLLLWSLGPRRRVRVPLVGGRRAETLPGCCTAGGGTRQGCVTPRFAGTVPPGPCLPGSPHPTHGPRVHPAPGGALVFVCVWGGGEQVCVCVCVCVCVRVRAPCGFVSASRCLNVDLRLSVRRAHVVRGKESTILSLLVHCTMLGLV